MAGASLLLAPQIPALAQTAPRPAPVAPAGDTIRSIRVVGNQRIEEGTILSYMLVQPGDSFVGDRVDKSLRTLYATGLFADVALKRDGSTLVVTVVENPLVATINYEGNHNVKEEDLRKELTMKPRAVFSVRQAQADRQKILNVYASKGRFAATVDPQLVRLPQNRVKVIFHIVEGPKTTITRIAFVGNHAFGEKRLRSVIDSKEDRWWRFFSSSQDFNPSRVDFDRELLRRFYLSQGYADFDVTTLAAELSPDRKEFFVTFQIKEGEKYSVGKVEVKSSVPKLTPDPYRKWVSVSPGDTYNGDKIEQSGNDIEEAIRKDNVVFVKVDPKIARHPEKHTIDLLYEIVPGPRVYVERIDISGNSVTRDKVIRREFRFAEGDPQDPTLIRQTKVRLGDLGYFSDVKVTPKPGSAADRSVVEAEVTERATGELSLGGGYSTTSGILGQAGLRQHNLIGTGIDAGISGTLAARESQIDLNASDPYFLDRNLVAGGDIFYLTNNNRFVSAYRESRYGASFRLGYAFNDHVIQTWNYSLINRNVTGVDNTASLFILDAQGGTTLSQIGQTLTFDWRDSRVDPHSGYVIRAGTDFAGVGGTSYYTRLKLDGTYWIPLERVLGNPDFTISLQGGAGRLITFNKRERIIDRFFLGGDNLRGFFDQGVGPHSVAYSYCYGPLSTSTNCYRLYRGSDSLGGNTIWTGSAEFHFPLPVSQDFGLAGRAFVDAGGLFGLQVPPNAVTQCLATSQRNKNGQIVDRHGDPISRCYYDDNDPRMSAGIGFSWKSPFGLINVDLGIPFLRKPYDQKQVFRFGFGTRFQ